MSHIETFQFNPVPTIPAKPEKEKRKVRKRCGVCGPCNIQNNCEKCKNCLNRRMKQTCVLRKCIQLTSTTKSSRTTISTTLDSVPSHLSVSETNSDKSTFASANISNVHLGYSEIPGSQNVAFTTTMRPGQHPQMPLRNPATQFQAQILPQNDMGLTSNYPPPPHNALAYQLTYNQAQQMNAVGANAAMFNAYVQQQHQQQQADGTTSANVGIPVVYSNIPPASIPYEPQMNNVMPTTSVATTGTTAPVEPISPVTDSCQQVILNDTSYVNAQQTELASTTNTGSAEEAVTFTTLTPVVFPTARRESGCKDRVLAETASYSNPLIPSESTAFTKIPSTSFDRDFPATDNTCRPTSSEFIMKYSNDNPNDLDLFRPSLIGDIRPTLSPSVSVR